MGTLIKKLSNFKRNVLIKLVKQNQNSQFLSGLVSELNLEAGDTVNLLDSLGPYCNKVGLTKTSLQNSDSIFFLNIFLAARHGFFLNE